MLKNNIIVFPPKLCLMLPSLLVGPVYKPLLAAISWHQKCGLYTSIYDNYMLLVSSESLVYYMSTDSIQFNIFYSTSPHHTIKNFS